jgi:hypothetical protein
MFEQLVNEALRLAVAPVEAFGKIANARHKISPLQPGVLIILAGW